MPSADRSNSNREQSPKEGTRGRVQQPSSAPRITPAANRDAGLSRQTDVRRRAQIFRSLQKSHGNAYVQRLMREEAGAGPSTPGQTAPLVARADIDMDTRRPNPGHQQLVEAKADEFPTAPESVAPTTAPIARIPIQRTASPTAAIQREGWTMPYLTLKPDSELVQDGLGGSVVSINEIRNFGTVSVDDRFKLLDKLINQGPQEFTGRDGSTVAKIWGSFGDLEATANANGERWKKSVAHQTSLASLPGVVALKERFEGDVRETAKSYINTNRTLIRQQQIEYGVLTFDDEKPAPVDDEQARKLIDMQVAAESVARNQKVQEDARQTLVGYKYGGSAHGTTMWMPVTFDPYSKPDKDESPEKGDAKPKTTWDTMKAAWDDSVAAVKPFLKKFPALYAISREASSGLTSQFAKKETPEQARSMLAKAMEALIKDIQAAEKALDTKSGKLNPLDLTPIAEGLLDGSKQAAGSTTQWGTPFGAFAGREALKDHQFSKALSALGYTAAAEALFIVAPFTGPASLFFILGGLAVLGTKAGESQQQYEMLAQVAKTGVTPETELVTEKEVSMASMEADADKAALALAALTIVGAAVIGAVSSAITAARLRALVPDAAVLTRLRQLAGGDDSALLGLLRRAKNAADAEELLTKMGSVEKAIEALTTRERFATFRSKFQARLDANPDLEKALRAAEKLAADPAKQEEAGKALDAIAESMQSLVSKELGITKVTEVTVAEAKFEYIFGNAAEDAHNTPRSEQNASYMNQIGVNNTADGRALLREHLEKVPYDPSNLVETSVPKPKPGVDLAPIEIRESLVHGPGGSLKIRTFWEARGGSRRLTSVQPNQVQPLVKLPKRAPGTTPYPPGFGPGTPNAPTPVK